MTAFWIFLAVHSGLAAGPVPGLKVSERTWQGSRWVVAEVDLSMASLDLVGQRATAPSPHTLGRTARQLKEAGVEVGFATNAGIYMEDRRPLGLHIEAGHQHRDVNRAEGHGNFYMKPNGIFALGAEGAIVRRTTEVPDDPAGFTLATQSGPLLVRDDVIHPKFLPESKSRKVRSVVGVRDPQHIVLAVSVDRVRFYDAATFLRDELGCADALYLDGTVSSWWTPKRSHIEGDPDGYGGILVVTAPGG